MILRTAHYVSELKKFTSNHYRPQRSWGKLIFSETCDKNSVHGAGGHAWQGVCMAGGHVSQGACMVGEWGCAWQGGLHGRGHAWWGCVCVVGGHVWCDRWGACMAGGRRACMAGGMHGRGHVWQGGMHGMQIPLPPADTTRYSDTVNEQEVRILLECILVCFSNETLDMIYLDKLSFLSISVESVCLMRKYLRHICQKDIMRDNRWSNSYLLFFLRHESRK